MIPLDNLPTKVLKGKIITHHQHQFAVKLYTYHTHSEILPKKAMTVTCLCTQNAVKSLHPPFEQLIQLGSVEKIILLYPYNVVFFILHLTDVYHTLHATE